MLTRARALERGDGPAPGSLNVQHRLIGALSRAIKGCPKSRYQVAGEMSELLGVEVSRHMLDAWTAESKELHRFPAEFVPAFCIVTGCNEPMRVLGDAAGVFVVRGPEALRAEIRKRDERIRAEKSEKRRMEALLEEMERGQA